MKHPIRTALQRVQYFWRPFCYWLAPVLILLSAIGSVYLAVHVELSEKAQVYSVFFLILTFLVTAFFLLISLPCALFSGYLSVMTMVREKRYVLPGVLLALDAGLLVVWILALQKFIL